MAAHTVIYQQAPPPQVVYQQPRPVQQQPDPGAAFLGAAAGALLGEVVNNGRHQQRSEPTTIIERETVFVPDDRGVSDQSSGALVPNEPESSDRQIWMDSIRGQRQQ